MLRVLFVIVIFAFITGGTAYGQPRKGKSVVARPAPVKLSPDDYPNLRIQVDAMNEAGVKGDHETVVSSTYPKLVTAMGGRAKMISFMEQTFSQLRLSGIEIKSIETDSITQLERVGTQLFAVIKIKMTVSTLEGDRSSHSSLVGVSADKGNTWKFLSALRQKDFNTMFPAAASKIRVTPMTMENSN